MSDESMPSEAQIKHNKYLWKWFPLGQVDAIWTLVEYLHGYVGSQYSSEIEAVLDALQKLDNKIRANNYPLPKKRVKRYNGILRRSTKKTR